jgi:hypothetical protein
MQVDARHHLMLFEKQRLSDGRPFMMERLSALRDFNGWAGVMGAG